MWDLYIYTLKQGVMYRDYENIKKLIEFNEIIGEDKRIDILQKNLIKNIKRKIIKTNEDLKENLYGTCSILRIENMKIAMIGLIGLINTNKYSKKNSKELLFWMKKKLKEEKE